jgi:hypothetical protein
MPREGTIVFPRPVGNLDVRIIECDKRGRRGRYAATVLSSAQAANLSEVRGAFCPNLP